MTVLGLIGAAPPALVAGPRLADAVAIAVERADAEPGGGPFPHGGRPPYTPSTAVEEAS
ncbi:hypothetical protein [Streptomyces halobius]|uniref:Uncharacterized protein n=1 Tax=Streptomyces halobius TaxID=2879846 RepID=A0ABY4ME12_9ACTN|nr:hypothetical protein [Streptomyces halobius]UQA95703.1 hypothetical protein K9S39_31005 [Streptomyces halobius]